jgi:hypothetical protein
MWIRVALSAGVIVIALGFASMPFSAGVQGYKGPGSPAPISCSAPIISGWAGGNTHRSVPGGVEYDSSQQCGQDARQRLVVAGLVAVVALGALSLSLWRGLRDSYPLGTTW